TETAVLWAAGNGLNRGERVLSGVEQFPSCLQQGVAWHAPTEISPLQTLTQGVFYYLMPNLVPVASDDRIGTPFERFIGEDGGVDPAHDHSCTLGFCLFQDVVPC